MSEAGTFVTVANYKVFDLRAERWRYPPNKATREHIMRVFGILLDGTEEVVPAAEIDDEGRHVPPRDR